MRRYAPTWYPRGSCRPALHTWPVMIGPPPSSIRADPWTGRADQDRPNNSLARANATLKQPSDLRSRLHYRAGQHTRRVTRRQHINGVGHRAQAVRRGQQKNRCCCIRGTNRPFTPCRSVSSDLAVGKFVGCLRLPPRLPSGAWKPVEHVIAGSVKEALDLGDRSGTPHDLVFRGLRLCTLKQRRRAPFRRRQPRLPRGPNRPRHARRARPSAGDGLRPRKAVPDGALLYDVLEPGVLRRRMVSRIPSSRLARASRRARRPKRTYQNGPDSCHRAGPRLGVAL
jgi:hypothetical protein